MKRQAFLRALAAALLHGAALPVLAQGAGSYPNKPIKIVVPYAAGGGTDIVARIVAQKMQEGLGQQVLVENRPSTAGIIGCEVVAKSAPDGYTLLIGASGPIVFNPALYAKLSYSPQKDFVAISNVGSFPLVLSVHPGSPFKSVPELVAYTRANPGKANYGASAASFRLATELLKSKTGIQGEHIPYKGSMESINAVSSGQVTMTLVDAIPAIGPVKGGLLRGLAVTSPKRMAALPDVPTMAEQGIDLTIQLWSGLLGPAGMPKAIVDKLAAEVQRIVRLPDVRERLAALAIEPEGSTPEQFAKLIATEIPLWSAVAKANNIHAD
jgi:tripartite-type tricarboxylate transporter receptor subunit TctC